VLIDFAICDRHSSIAACKITDKLQRFRIDFLSSSMIHSAKRAESGKSDASASSQWHVARSGAELPALQSQQNENPVIWKQPYATGHHQLVTDRIMAKLQAGFYPGSTSLARHCLSRNCVSKKCYQGIKSLLDSGSKIPSEYWGHQTTASDLGGIRSQKVSGEN